MVPNQDSTNRALRKGDTDSAATPKPRRTRMTDWLKSEPVVLTALFCLAELLWYRLGIYFDHVDPVTAAFYVQYVEPTLLRDRFFETLYYLHVQPPLFHAFLGVMFQLPEKWHVAVFSVAFSAMALALVLCSRALLADLGVSRITRLIACGYLIVSPPLVLLAKWFYVPMSVAALLVAAAMLLHRAACRRKTRYFLGYGLCVSAVALITAYFHLVWVLAALGLGARVALCDGPRAERAGSASSRRRWRLAAICLPGVLVLAVYLKTWALFGFFGASTWSAVAPSRTARAAVGSQVVEQLIAKRYISPLMREDLQQLSVERVMQLSETEPAPTGVPVLDQRRRLSGQTNWNYVGLLPAYRRLARDARTLAIDYPAAWLSHSVESFRRYQAPATVTYSVERNRRKMLGWCESFENVVWGTTLGAALERTFGRLGWVALPTLVVPLLLLHAVWTWFRSGKRGAAREAERVTVAFLAGNVLYVAAVAIGVADAEHERYHFFSDALLFLLVCHACSVWFRRWAPVVIGAPIALSVLVALGLWIAPIVRWMI